MISARCVTIVFGVMAMANAFGAEGEKPTPVPTRTIPYRTVVVHSEEAKYTGEPISLSLKDADIRDVLKTFATLTHLNIVVDPSVSGSVTVELRNVPWDQAFELILTINGLDYQFENNVVYVAPREKLARQPLYGKR
jgi:type II secretory pathway component HofQ